MERDSLRNEYKLIADFLGYQYVPRTDKEAVERKVLLGWYKPLQFPFIEGKHIIKFDSKASPCYVTRKTLDLNFRYDWNKLMEVVNFIEEIKNVKYGGFKVIIEKDYCLIQSLNRSKSSAYSKSYWSNGNKINAVYNSCLMFIEWYNENVK